MSNRTVSWPCATALVVSSMVGVGVYTSVGFQLEAIPSGFPILLLWLLGGLVSLCGALSYAELVAMWPRSGGEYHLLRETYHPMVGFLAGWISITAGFAAPIAALAIACAHYLAHLGWPGSPTATGAALVLVIASLHLGSNREAGTFMSGMTTIKILLIVFFLAAAVAAGRGDVGRLLPREGDLSLVASAGFATSMVYVMFAYSGWNGAAYIAGELAHPERSVPRALGWGTVWVTLLYVALNAAFLAYAPWDRMRGQVEAGMIAAESALGQVWGRAMGAIIAVGILSTMAAYTWAGSRVGQRMGEDFPRLRMLAVRNRCGAPHGALILQTMLALVMLATGRFDVVVNYLMVLLQVCGLLAVAAVWVMRIRKPAAPRPFRVPGYPLTPLIFMAATLWILVHQFAARPVESAWGLTTVLIGIAIYRWART